MSLAAFFPIIYFSDEKGSGHMAEAVSLIYISASLHNMTFYRQESRDQIRLLRLAKHTQKQFAGYLHKKTVAMR